MNPRDGGSLQWEYIEIPATELAPALRQYQEAGWELVNVVPVPAARLAGRRPRVPRACLPLVAAVVVIMLFVLFLTFAGGRPRDREIPVSELVQDVRSGKVAAIVMKEGSNRLTIYYGDPGNTDTRVATSIKEPESSLLEYLVYSGVSPEAVNDVKMEVEPASALADYLGIAGFCLPLVVFISTLAWIGWRMQSYTQQWSMLAIFKRPVPIGGEQARQAG